MGWKSYLIVMAVIYWAALACRHCAQPLYDVSVYYPRVTENEMGVHRV